MAYYMNKSVPAKRGDIFYISNSKCYATDPSNTEGRPAIVVSSDKLNEHADVVEVVYLTTKEKRLMPTHAEVLCKIPSTALCETILTKLATARNTRAGTPITKEHGVRTRERFSCPRRLKISSV